ncbi:hypothetical protein JTB14_023585 [Gonioctena quinquepunctata]|nr:hypothetical protein JTB14_023585 [Gonioctena quinquepunctata]
MSGGDIHFWSSGTRWIDGKNFIWLGTAKPIGYTNWQQGQPDNINKKCLGLELTKNKDLYWSDRDCNNQYHFVCEKEDKKVEKENERNWPAIFGNPNVSPNVNLLNFKDKSYYFNNYFLATFLDANFFCQAIDMELVTIESDDENTRLYNYIRDTLVGDSFWSSGTKLVDDKTWIWLSTGKRVEYTHWQPGVPNNKNAKCIQLIQQRNKGLMWNDLACTTALHFICQSPTKKYTHCPSPGNENSPSTSAPVTPVTEPTVPPKHQEKYKLSTDQSTGIHSADREQVFKKLPPKQVADPTPIVENALTAFLKEQRSGDAVPSQRKITRLEVQPGCSISMAAHGQESDDDGDGELGIDRRASLSSIRDVGEGEANSEDFEVGQFILGTFHSQRGKITYKYVCKILEVDSNILVVGLKSVRKSKRLLRVVPDDTSELKASDIIKFLPNPSLKKDDNNIFHTFKIDIEVLEM